MEPGDYQHCKCGINNLYFYANCGTVCNTGNIDYCYRSANNANVCSDRPLMPEQYSAYIANNIY